MLSTPSQRGFPRCCLLSSFNVHLMISLSHPSKEKRLPSASTFYAPLLQVISGVISLVLCLQAVSQAPQHFRSSETQATCDGCFARWSICSLTSPDPSMSQAIHPQSPQRWLLNTATCHKHTAYSGRTAYQSKRHC